MRDGGNAARGRGHVDHILPGRSKVRALKQHAALPYAEIVTLIEKLRRSATRLRW
jgi:hypothetical protein